MNQVSGERWLWASVGCCVVGWVAYGIPLGFAAFVLAIAAGPEAPPRWRAFVATCAAVVIVGTLVRERP
jgi:hypothetical protein